MQDNQHDHILMQRAGNGDQAAFRLLAARHLNFALRVAERVLGDRAEAEDVAQESLVKLWQAAPDWRPEAKVSTWLYRVVTNACIDRKRRFRLVTDDFDTLPDPAPSADKAMIQKQEADRVKRALQSIPERQRAAVVLSYYEGLRNEEAAAALQMKTNAFQQLLYRARQNLKDLLEEKEDGHAQNNG